MIKRTPFSTNWSCLASMSKVRRFLIKGVGQGLWNEMEALYAVWFTEHLLFEATVNSLATVQ